jgi:hypothetical protein
MKDVSGRIGGSAFRASPSAQATVKFLVPIFLCLTDKRNPFTIHEWSFLLASGTAAIFNSFDASKLKAGAAKAPLSADSVEAAREYRRLSKTSADAMVESGGFIQNIESTPVTTLSADPIAVEHIKNSRTMEVTDGYSSRLGSIVDGGQAPVAKQHRQEASSYDEKRTLGIATHRCRYCGHLGHNWVYRPRDGRSAPTSCPFYETSPHFNPRDPWGFVIRVERGECEAATIRRKDAKGQEVPIKRP